MTEFNDRIFLQIRGAAMGKPYSPSLANLYLKKFDKAAKFDFRIKPIIYFRFLDDIKIVMKASRQDVADYQEFLSSIIEGIKVELNARDRVIEFLDTRVPYIKQCGRMASGFLKPNHFSNPPIRISCCTLHRFIRDIQRAAFLSRNLFVLSV